MKCNVMGHTWVTEDDCYGKFPKILNNKRSDKMAYANSVDPDQTAP